MIYTHCIFILYYNSAVSLPCNVGTFLANENIIYLTVRKERDDTFGKSIEGGQPSRSTQGDLDWNMLLSVNFLHVRGTDYPGV